MKVLNLKRVGATAAAPILIAAGITGMGLNSTNVEITQMQFDTMRNELALDCYLRDGEMEYNRLQLFIAFANQQNKDDRGSEVKEYKEFKDYCKSMIRLQ